MYALVRQAVEEGSRWLRDFTMATDVGMAGEGLAVGHFFSTYDLSHLYDKASLLHPTRVQAVEREQSQ
jgi:hypothetical protein